MAKTDSIPAQCSFIERGTVSALMKDEYTAGLLKLGVMNPRRLLMGSLRHEQRLFTGRGPLISLPLDESGGARVVIKQCLRGGLIRHLSREIFCGGNRPFDEMRANRAIVERGIKTAEIIAAVKEKLPGPFYRAYIFSLELSDCTDLTSYFNLLQGRTLEQRFCTKAGVLKEVARAFSAMHRSGIYHRDLHLKNVLLRAGESQSSPEVFIIDFDRAVLKDRLRPGEKLNNLMRFNRSIEKHRVFSGTITRGDQMRLCRTYLAENEDAARLLPRALNRYRVMNRLRRLKWGLCARMSGKGAGLS